VSWVRITKTGGTVVHTMHSHDDGKTWRGGPWKMTGIINGTDPAVFSDGKGGWRLVYVQSSTLPNSSVKEGDIRMQYGKPGDWQWPTPKGWNGLPGAGKHWVNSDAGSDSANDRAPAAATDGKRWVVVWQRDEQLPGPLPKWSRNIYSAVSLDDGKSWSPPNRVSTHVASGAANSRGPAFAYGDNLWVVAWTATDPNSGDDDVYYSRSSDGLTWNAPQPLNNNAGTDSGTDGGPSIATDGKGNWRAVWTSTDSLSGTLGTDEDVLYARYTVATNKWTAPAPVNSNASIDTAKDADGAARIAYGGGRWRVVWESNRAAASPVSGKTYDIYEALDVASTVAPWVPPSLVHSRQGAHGYRHDMYPDIAVADTWDYLVVWSSDAEIPGETQPSDWDIFYVRRFP